jgi:membrane protein YqaA with SNARE-associated domain
MVMVPRGGVRPNLAESDEGYRPATKYPKTRRIGATGGCSRITFPCLGAESAPDLSVARKVGTAGVESLYLGLFVTALLAATVLPGASEILMLGLVVKGLDLWTLWLVATLGNVAGSTLNWWLGRYALRFSDRRWFPVSRAGLERAQGWFKRWGQPSILFSWLPGVGDAFTVAAGVMRMPLATFLLFVAIAKGGRYAAVIGASQGLGIEGWF